MWRRAHGGCHYQRCPGVRLQLNGPAWLRRERSVLVPGVASDSRAAQHDCGASGVWQGAHNVCDCPVTGEMLQCPAPSGHMICSWHSRITFVDCRGGVISHRGQCRCRCALAGVCLGLQHQWTAWPRGHADTPCTCTGGCIVGAACGATGRRRQPLAGTDVQRLHVCLGQQQAWAAGVAAGSRAHCCRHCRQPCQGNPGVSTAKNKGTVLITDCAHRQGLWILLLLYTNTSHDTRIMLSLQAKNQQPGKE